MTMVVWPTANDIGGGGKGEVLTEGYWQSMLWASMGSVIGINWGLNGYFPSGLSGYVRPGIAVLYGALFHLDADYAVTLTANDVNYCWLELTFNANIYTTLNGAPIYATNAHVTAAAITVSVDKPAYVGGGQFPNWNAIQGTQVGIPLFQATTNVNGVTALTDRRPIRTNIWSVSTFT